MINSGALATLLPNSSFTSDSERCPRILMVTPEVALPELRTISKPGTCPCNASMALDAGDFTISAAFTEAIEPVRSRFFITP